MPDSRQLDSALVADIAASEPRDIAQAILALRDALVLLVAEVEDRWASTDTTKRARQVIDDLDAGELLWPGWKRGRP